MLINRRGLIVGAAAATISGKVFAQSKQPLEMLVPWAPGGSTDIIARLFSVPFGAALGRSVIVDNQSGAAGTLGHAAMAKAEGNGNRVLVGTNSTYAIAPSLYRNLPYVHERDLAPVSLLAQSPLTLCVSATSGISSVSELVDRAKASPDELNYGSGGVGSTGHLATEFFMDITGTSMDHVIYRGGGQTLQGLLSDEIQVAFLDISVAMDNQDNERIKIIGISSPERFSVMPELPTIAEAGFAAFESTTAYALFVPASTSPEIISGLEQAARTAVNDADFGKALRDRGIEAIGSTAEELAEHVRSESAKWARVITERNITVE